MPTRRKSARSSGASAAPIERVKRSRVARDIISGLKEAAAFTRGEISLPVRIVWVEPSPTAPRAPTRQ